MKNNKKISNILAIFIILGIALINNIDFFNNTDSDYETGRVVRVVDGDTAVVKIKNENQKVRFIGVDTQNIIQKEIYLSLGEKKHQNLAKIY